MLKDKSVMEGIHMERRRGYVLVYPASPLVPVGYIDIDGAVYRDEGPMGPWQIRYPPLTLALRTNFYCNSTGVDRVMWNGYTRAGVRIS